MKQLEIYRIISIIIFPLSFSTTPTIWASDLVEALYNNSTRVLVSYDDSSLPLSKSVSINDNSTLAKALALARQFIVRVPSGRVTSQNVEVFKRSHDGERLANLVKKDKPKLYSWWMITKKPSLSEEDDNSASSEYEQITTDEPEEVTNHGTEAAMEQLVTMKEKVPSNDSEIQPTTIEVPIKDPLITSPPKKRPTTIIPLTKTPMSTTSYPTSTPSMPTSKPRPSKRPPLRTKRPSQKDKDNNNSTSSDLPTNSGSGSPSEEPQNFIPDPFGVKKKFVEIARSVASSTAEKVAPIAKGTARQAGILVLTAAGQLGTLTKNAAESTYADWAKRLNATTELLGEGKEKGKGNDQKVMGNKPESSKPSTGGIVIGNPNPIPEYEICSGVRESCSFIIILLGSFGLVALNNVLL